ncbi:MAG: MBL fold metallo-hydrolase [Christensenellales bacterium]|jgi:L-ascorbate metabolism protein UlaG (beta-lactamase superfamily)
MIITYHGHAEFLLETADGRRVLFDPFPSEIGFPMRRVKADVVCISHHHFDHNHVDKVDGKPIVIDTEGTHIPLPGIRVRAVKAYHDQEQGKLRGEILCTRVETDGLSVLHLGDLGEVPGSELAEQLFMPDILLIPIGGTYTLDADMAAQTIKLLQPRVIIPMHYKSPQGGIDKITTLAPFVEAMAPLIPSVQPLIRVTREDLSCQPHLVELTVR